MPAEFIHNPTAAEDGMYVATVGVALPRELPGNPNPPPRPTGAMKVSPPPPPGRSVVLAYCWLVVVDGRGNQFAVSDVRLVEGKQGRSLNYPSEVRPLPCKCGERNTPRAAWCNWCGTKLEPQAEYRRHQLANPANEQTADMILRAVSDAYDAAREAEWARTRPELTAAPSG